MGLLHPFRDRRRQRLIRRPFPAEWSRIIGSNAACCRCLSPDERGRLESLVKVFVGEKAFEGCGGLEVTDEIRVTVAAQACLLLLNIDHDYYGRLSSVLVYPEGFAFEEVERGGMGVFTVTERTVSGLSSSSGAVALSWPDAKLGAAHGDGTNVVLHEFAHQLDLRDDAMDGAPALYRTAMRRDWARVLGAEYGRLRALAAAGEPSLISAYGATKPAEFFAVVTELFFERPCELRRQHPALYGEFMLYYRQDPAARLEECRA